MNRHLGEGTLQALLDGGLPAGERPAAEAHLAACGECAAAARELRALNERAASLLARGDVPAPVAQAQMSLRARRARRGQWGEARRALLRAAVLVVGLAGVAAAAVPGSPVREWIEEAVLPAKRETLPADARRAPVPPPRQDAPAAPTGISIRPDGGAVRVVLSGASPRLQVTARLVDGDRAEVLVRGRAMSGARFRTAPGRIEVVDAGAGEVEVEIPRAARSATVEVNGRVFVVKEGDSLRVLAPAGAPGGGPAVRVGG